MSKSLVSILFLFAATGVAFCGTIFETSSAGLADVRVLIVNSSTQADICVFVTKRAEEARGKDEIWYYSNTQGLADAKICFVRQSGIADLKVYFVSSASQAGWKTSSKFRGAFK